MRRVLWAAALAGVLWGCESDDAGPGPGATGDVPDVSTSADAEPGDVAGTPDAEAGDGEGAPDVSQDVSQDVTGGDATDVAPDAPADADTTGGEVTLPEGVDIVDLGIVEHAVDPAASEVVTVDVPADAVSFAVSVVGQTGVTYALDAVTAPSGEVVAGPAWFDSSNNPGGPTLCLGCPLRISAAEAAHAALVPNNPAVAVEAGTWSFRVQGYTISQGGGFPPVPVITPAAGEADVQVTVKRVAGGLPAAGVLDLNLHLTGGGGLTAETAPTDARLQEALETFADIYAQAGVEVGQITYRDVDPAWQVVDGIMGPDNDFEAVAALTQGGPSGVNLVFVREIVDSSSPFGGFGVILGVSGGIPGPVDVPGSGRSAVIVATEVDPRAADVGLGVTMAHEVGHYLGLFHSSEMPFAGNIHDPLPDTPQNDATNLMYFEGGSGGTGLSAQQGEVLRANPSIHVTTPDEVSP